jgi:hypothetical protein
MMEYWLPKFPEEPFRCTSTGVGGDITVASQATWAVVVELVETAKLGFLC